MNLAPPRPADIPLVPDAWCDWLAVADSIEAQFIRGDEAALRAAYDAHSPLIYTFCRRALGDERGQDVTQEVFVSAWRARTQFDPSRGNLAGWLIGIAKNRITDNIRAERRHSNQQAISSDDELSVEPDVDRVGDRLLVANALDNLPERSKMVIELAFFSDLTHAQVAERTSLPLGTVKSDIRRGLAQIREQMEASHG